MKYKDAYRVIENVNANDFNNEPIYRIQKYEVDIENNRMRSKGYKDWHRIMPDTVYSETEAIEELNRKLKRK